MSMFLEILRCILCCAEENKDENEYETSYGNTSWQTIIPITYRNTSRSNDSANFRSTYVNSVERSYNVPSSSNSYTIYESTSSYSPHTSSSRLPQPSSIKPTSSSSPSLSRPKPPASSSNQPRSLAPEIPFSKPSPSSSSSKSFAQAPKVLPSSKYIQSPIPAIPSSKLSPQAPSNSINPSASLLEPPTSHCKPSPSFTTTASCSKPIPKTPPSSLETSLSSSKPPQSVKPAGTPASSNATNQQTKANQKWVRKNTSPIRAVQTSHSESSTSFSPKAPPSSAEQSPSSSKPPPSFKPTLAPAFSNLANQQTKTDYIWVQKDASPIYIIPKDMQDLIKKDEVPKVLEMPLSMSTYKDYFAALLYAEDFYIEKWIEFNLKGIKLKLQEAAIFKQSRYTEINEKDDKRFVEFEIDAARERRPFLLSRDFVFAKPSGSNTEPFQGIIYRVVKSTKVLVEFGEDFHYQHYSSCKYDVSFSFNRVCLKRAHQAIEAAMDPSFRSFIFPDFAFKRIIPASSLPYCNYKLDAVQMSAVWKILTFQGSPPYLIDGPLCVTKVCKELSRTGLVVKEAVLEIYRKSREHRVLICAPINSTCDLLTRSLKKYIPESDMFRGNAAFREIDGVPLDVLPSCVYEGECFACPPLHELKKFRVILSTYISSFRLRSEGIAAGHFSHIFLLDASSATEPEAMVALANLANENTAVVVTGAPGNRSGWVRSDIARRYGLRESYFERLCDRYPYSSLDPMFITSLVESECNSDDNQSFMSLSLLDRT